MNEARVLTSPRWISYVHPDDVCDGLCEGSVTYLIHPMFRDPQRPGHLLHRDHWGPRRPVSGGCLQITTGLLALDDIEDPIERRLVKRRFFYGDCLPPDPELIWQDDGGLCE